MRYFALATDYDGTLAHDGVVAEPTLAALKRLKESGRHLILVTGRELDDLLSIFPQIDLFERVVAENGALLYRPASRDEKLLSEPPPEKFVATLRERGVAPLGVGRVIVATWEAQMARVIETIRDLELELQVIFNKGAVMVLPSGVNKATGLAVALAEMGLSVHNTVGVGDAENDHAFLGACECAVAVANALPALKEKADLVTQADHGAGVVELIEGLIKNDLQDLAPRLNRHDILLGVREDGAEVKLPAYGVNVLAAGPPGSGKSTLSTGMIERLIESRYQVCVIDPEGDYQTMSGAVMAGNPKGGPTVEEMLSILEKPEQSVVVNLIGVPYEQRPAFFKSLIPRLQELRAHTGRPHWIVLDEAHHGLPSAGTSIVIPQGLSNTMLITVQPDHVSPEVLPAMDILIVTGKEPGKTIHNFCEEIEQVAPPVSDEPLNHGEAVMWRRHAGEDPVQFRVAPCRTERVRHSRKYAAGELEPELSFTFAARKAS